YYMQGIEKLGVIKIKINLAKWGNSAAIRIPKKILEKLNIDSNNFENISFDVDIEGEVLILKKKQEKTKFELLAEQSKGERLNPKIDIDWGNPVGKEVW
ncbi:MAG TPA: AbrB/MazE/SpoVT family DNA-binding domain-containing protein, partial [Clostridia bacterium]|nr:AbrB/MazE/SpoVT family DNA-binding domain-containing protein [Clostridia bacterium]